MARRPSARQQVPFIGTPTTRTLKIKKTQTNSISRKKLNKKITSVFLLSANILFFSIILDFLCIILKKKKKMRNHWLLLNA